MRRRFLVDILSWKFLWNDVGIFTMKNVYTSEVLDEVKISRNDVLAVHSLTGSLGSRSKSICFCFQLIF